MKPKGLLLVIILISLDCHAWEGRFRYQGSQFVQVIESIESTPLSSSITFNQLGEWPFPVKSKNWVYLREESAALFMNNYSYPMHCNNHLAFYVVLVLHTCVGLYLFFNFAVQEMQLFSPWDYSLWRYDLLISSYYFLILILWVVFQIFNLHLTLNPI